MNKIVPAFDYTPSAYQMARVICPSCASEAGWMERVWDKREVCTCGQVLLSSVEEEATRKAGAEGASRYMTILKELGMIRDSLHVTPGGTEGLMDVAALVGAKSHDERVAVLNRCRATLEFERAMNASKSHASKESKWRQQHREDLAKKGARCGHCNRQIPPGGGYLYAAEALGRGMDTVSSSRAAWLLCGRCALGLTPFGCIYAAQDEDLEKDVHPGDLIEGTTRWRRALFSNIVRICKRKGLAPWQARRKARQLAMSFWKEPYDARMEAMAFWGV